MSQTSLSDLFGSYEEQVSQPVEDSIAIMRVLTAKPCTDCRLGQELPNNPGFLWKGNPEAHIAIVSDMPSHADISARRAFADGVGNELNNWIQMAGIGDKDTFITYLVQCETPTVRSKMAKRDNKQRSPNADIETGVCFQARCLRMLKTLPNLEVIWALGLTTMATLLGGDPRIKACQGFWFGTDLLPGTVVFGMPHPRDFDKTTSQSKRGRLKQHLTYFHNEYYGKTTAKGLELCPPKHIMNVLGYRQQERIDARPTELFW